MSRNTKSHIGIKDVVELVTAGAAGDPVSSQEGRSPRFREERLGGLDERPAVTSDSTSQVPVLPGGSPPDDFRLCSRPVVGAHTR